MKRNVLLIVFSFYLVQLLAQINKGEEYSAIHSGLAVGKNIQNLSFSFTRNMNFFNKNVIDIYFGIGIDNTLNATPIDYQITPAKYLYSIDNSFFYLLTARFILGFNFNISKNSAFGANIDVIDLSILKNLNKNFNINYDFYNFDSVSNSYSKNTVSAKATFSNKLPFIETIRCEFYYRQKITNSFAIKIIYSIIGTKVKVSSGIPNSSFEKYVEGQNISFLYGLGVSYIINPKKISP